MAFTAVIQLGSILAVLAYFRLDLLEVVRGIGRALRDGRWSDPAARLGVAIALGTVPIVLAGMALKLWFPGYETSPIRSVTSIGIISIVMALLLAIAELVGRRRRHLDGVMPRDGLLVGLAQALALVPGVSRSGSTLTASLFDGWERASAARFSFLLGIPAITLAGLVELKDALHEKANGGCCPPWWGWSRQPWCPGWRLPGCFDICSATAPGSSWPTACCSAWCSWCGSAISRAPIPEGFAPGRRLGRHGSRLTGNGSCCGVEGAFGRDRRPDPGHSP